MKKFTDKISQNILAALRENSRISWQQLGATAHLSPQACAERVRQMQAAGIISGFTLRESERPRHFITVLLAHNRFDEFERFLHGENGIERRRLLPPRLSGRGAKHAGQFPDPFECSRTLPHRQRHPPHYWLTATEAVRSHSPKPVFTPLIVILFQ